MRCLFLTGMLAIAALSSATPVSTRDVDEVALSWVLHAPVFGGRLSSEGIRLRPVPQSSSAQAKVTVDMLTGDQIVENPGQGPTSSWIDDILLPTASATMPAAALVTSLGVLSLYGIRRFVPQ